MDILPPQKIKISEIEGKGLGVIATDKIKAGEIIETCPIIFLSNEDADYIKNRSDFLLVSGRFSMDMKIAGQRFCSPPGWIRWL